MKRNSDLRNTWSSFLCDGNAQTANSSERGCNNYLETPDLFQADPLMQIVERHLNVQETHSVYTCLPACLPARRSVCMSVRASTPVTPSVFMYVRLYARYCIYNMDRIKSVLTVLMKLCPGQISRKRRARHKLTNV